MVSRRNWLRVWWGGFVALLTWPSSLLFGKNLSIELDQVPKLKQIGGQITIKLTQGEVLLIRDSERTVRIFNAHCTHKGCLVKYKEKDGRIECPCHGSQFDLNGNVLRGPAQRSLPSYSGEINGSQIIMEVPD